MITINKCIDLHTHSIISDGASTPEKLIEDAVKENVKAIALTDHDNIGGLKSAKIAAKKNNVEFLNGIEISSLYKGNRILHILGIGIDINNEEFCEAYNLMKQARECSVIEILNHIKKQGINISIDELREKSFDKYLDRYDIYRYFIRNNICSTAQEIWDKYLDVIPYGEGELMSAEKAIDVIKKSGGLSFLAHYNKRIGFGGIDNNSIEKEIKYLIDAGLDGIERYYPSFEQKDYEFLDYLIRKYNLKISGGTDYHGSNRPDIKIGSGSNNNLNIPYSVYKDISNFLKLL